MIESLNALAPAPTADIALYQLDGAVVEILHSGDQTAGSWALVRAVMPPGAMSPPHYHTHQDETFYVLEGELQVETQGRILTLRAGETLVMPRHIPHRPSNASAADTQVLVLSTPSGFVNFLQAAGERVYALDTPAVPMTAERMAHIGEISQRFGIIVVDEAAL